MQKLEIFDFQGSEAFVCLC